jgi:putative transposase
MSDTCYIIGNKSEIHFITFAVVEWVDVFSRKEYRDIVVESIKDCQKGKGWSFMVGWTIRDRVLVRLSVVTNYR